MAKLSIASSYPNSQYGTLTISPQSIANHSKLIPELPLSEPPIHFLQQVDSLQTTQPKSPVGFSLIYPMASATAISLALPMVAASSVSQRDALKPKQAHGSSLFTTPNKLYSPRLASSRSRVVMHASQSKKEQSLAGLTSLVLASTMVIPEIAEAAGSGVSPSLKNFLLSIAAGGVVATLIAGAVVGVSNFDPVKRN